jgi:hypothetical protein
MRQCCQASSFYARLRKILSENSRTWGCIVAVQHFAAPLKRRAKRLYENGENIETKSAVMDIG